MLQLTWIFMPSYLHFGGLGWSSWCQNPKKIDLHTYYIYGDLFDCLFYLFLLRLDRGIQRSERFLLAFAGESRPKIALSCNLWIALLSCLVIEISIRFIRLAPKFHWPYRLIVFFWFLVLHTVNFYKSSCTCHFLSLVLLLSIVLGLDLVALVSTQ